jgi:predicted ABC-type ATPase
MRAGRLMLEEMEALARRGADFGFETTLSGRGHLSLIRALKDKAYAVHFFYVWIPTVGLSLSRIGERVSRGGHNISEEVARRRFERSITNFLVHYRPLADGWMLFDNSGESPVVIASMKQGTLRLANKAEYNQLVARYGA